MNDFQTIKYIASGIFLLGLIGLFVTWGLSKYSAKKKFINKEIKFGDLWKQAYQYDKHLHDRFTPSAGITTSQGYTIGFDAGIVKVEIQRETQPQKEISITEIQEKLIEFLRKAPDVHAYQQDADNTQSRIAEYEKLLEEMSRKYPISREALTDDIIFSQKAEITNKHQESLFDRIKSKHRDSIKYFLIEDCEFTILGLDENGHGMLELIDKRNQKVQIKLLQDTLTDEGKRFFTEHQNQTSNPLTIFASIKTRECVGINKILLYSLLVTQ